MELLLDDRAAGSLGYICGNTEMAHSGGNAPHDPSTATKHIAALNPVRRPMHFGVHSRTLAGEKCRANINVRSTEFVIALKQPGKCFRRTTKQYLIRVQSVIRPEIPAAWDKYLDPLDLAERGMLQRGTCSA